MSKKIFFLITILVGLFFAISADAAYLASDLLGQLDGSDNPVYTTGSSNNGQGSPNNRGFNLAGVTALDSANHRLFVSDILNNRVLIFNLDSNDNLLDRVADYVLGQPDFTTSSAGLADNKMNIANGGTYDSVNNRLFIADTGNNRVLVFDVSNITNGESAIAVLGQPDFTSGSSSSSQSGLAGPTVAQYDPTTNRLYVAQQSGNRISVFTVTSTITNGQPADYVLCQADFTSNVATTTQSGCNQPTLAVIDTANQRLFVSDLNNNRIMVFDVNSITNGENAINVIGQSNFTSNASGTTQSTFWSPGSVAYDSANNRIYVAEAATDGPNNQRVMIFDVASITNGEAAVAVLGQPDFTTNNPATTTQSGFSEPSASVFDTNNNRLFVGDLFNNRILFFDFVRITETSLANGTVGTAYSQAINTTSSQGTTTLSISSGSLPSGLTLGSITGTPTTAGDYTFTILATDDNGGIGTFVGSKQFTITISAAATPTPSTTGGTVDIASLLPFEPPLQGLKLLINNGSPTTNSRYVTLTLEGGQDAKNLKLATLPDFSNSLGQEPYKVSIPFDLCLNQTNCPAKNYTVYVTFYNQGGHPSQVISDSITLTSSQAVIPSQREVIQNQIKALQLQVVQLLQQLLQILRGGR